MTATTARPCSCPARRSRCGRACRRASPRSWRAGQQLDLYRRLREDASGTARSSSCTTARPTPTAICTWAPRSTRSSRTWSTAASRCWARTRSTCPAGTATACRSSGRSSSATGRRARTRTRCRRPSSGASAASSPSTGSTSSARSSSAWAWSATGTHPYTTMDYRAEAGIFRELAKFLLSGELYRGKKSVMWSVVEKTALAEAEVEYHDHTSTTITVRFPVVETAAPGARGRFGPDLDHHALDHARQPRGRLWRGGRLPGDRGDRRRRAGRHAPRRREAAARRARWSRASRQRPGSPAIGRSPSCQAAALAGTDPAPSAARPGLRLRRCRCWRRTSSTPSRAPASSTSRPRTAPTTSSSARGTASRCRTRSPRTASTPTRCRCSPGLHVFKAAEPVIAALLERGALLARGKLTHSYPHSWRSKAPLIFRATPQWFIPMDGAGRLRAKALAAIEATRWVPAAGQEPDPRHDREPARLVRLAPARLGRADRGVRAQGERRGAARPGGGRADRGGLRAGAAPMPGSRPIRRSSSARSRDPADYEQVTDILDVWFDSGSTHADRARAAARARLAGLALSRGLGPAPRLVPLLAARELRHARPGALRGGPDPRLRGRRAGPQDVEVARQRGLAARSDEDPRRRHPAAVDGQRRLRRGRPDRRGDPGRPGRRLPPAAQHAALSARQPRRLQRGRAAAARRRCRSSSAGCCIAWPSSTGWCARPTRRSTSRACTRRCTTSARPTCRRSTSTCARTRSIAIGRTPSGGAPRAPCSTSCSTA